MALSRDTLTAALASLLGDSASMAFDTGANGLQVRGADVVTKAATAMSASLRAIDAARDAGAQALIVHHGLRVNAPGGAVPLLLDRRLRALYVAGISLYGYHYALDRHPVVGNAVGLAKAIGAVPGKEFGSIDGHAWGCEAAFLEPLPVLDLVDVLAKERGAPLLAAHSFGPSQVRRIGVVTGSGSGCLAEAAEKGLDALVVGDLKEGTQEEARELGVSLLALGHAASETYGTKALAAWIERELGIEAAFIDIPNAA